MNDEVDAGVSAPDEIVAAQLDVGLIARDIVVVATGMTGVVEAHHSY